MLPSQIGDVDMLRIREAEKVILREESKNGRYIRDGNNKLIPQEIWNQLQALREHEEQKNRLLKERINQQKTIDEKLEMERSQQMALQESMSKLDAKKNKGSLRGLKSVQKQGGMLVSLSKSGTKGSPKKPKVKSHFAQLDEEIKRQHRDNQRLFKKLDRMRLQLEQEEKEIDHLEQQKNYPIDLKLRKIRYEEKSEEYERQMKELERRKEETLTQEMKRKMMKERRRIEQEKARQAIIDRKNLESLHLETTQYHKSELEIPEKTMN